MIEDTFKRQVRQHLQTSELTTHQQKQILATHPKNQDKTHDKHQMENMGNIVHEVVANQVIGKSNPRLNKTWQQIFSTALRPPRNTNTNTPTQFPMRERTALLKPATNEQIGTPMTKVHNNLRILSINANTLILRSGLAELHELCLQIQKYNISVICFQEVNIDLLDYKIRTAIEAVFNQYFVNKIYFSSTPI